MEKLIAYHVTYKSRVPTIKKKGLVPKKPEDAEDIEAVFLFKSKEDVENALMNWLGERLDGDKEVVILTLDITGLHCVDSVEYEWACLEKISPDRILKIESEEE